MNKLQSPPVIVGAGPAGMLAAQTLVRKGLRPVVLDENARHGGQIYRQPPAHFQRSPKALYGFESGKAEAVLQAMQDLLPHIDYRPNTLVWNAQAACLDLLHEGKTSVLPYGALLVATGATDRILPFLGWTLPGVFSLGGAQVALKFQGCAIGRQVVFAGTGPLLYLVAYQYAKAGGQVAAILDSAQWSDQLRALPELTAQASMLSKGVYYVAWLMAHGVPIHRGALPVQALGKASVEQLIWRDKQGEHRLVCDAVATGYGLRSETQLADLLGCEWAYDEADRAWLPAKDSAGRASVPGVYLAGDGAGIQGADAAQWSGERAAWALLSDQGLTLSEDEKARIDALDKMMARRRIFGAGLTKAFPEPRQWPALTSDAVVICRCEEITAGDIRNAAKASGALELNRLKAFSRVGMGRCQGRMCGCAAAELLAHCTQQSPSQVGRLRGQAPIKPIPFENTFSAQTEGPA
ncbi:FAD/NAD(P)-binding oxidoreductase [Limnohabitans sp. WS1]|uniref:NAD(P)/FAD-dependent oxidoreductase n=1 Tax=Limnohabitans sp. WS1 TaxID=1100726 RepID=UPI000D38E4A9|nr:FAD/NAD(P)-binding oxidoreductase [Limnohabitans sp. WS1]PUE21472.1 FAD/NAD(P)-binding oxidoreductase [Limnohabitans sp. WS1]